MRPIKNGNVVKVYYTEGTEIGVVLHAPQDVGDWWYLRIDGKVVGINPVASVLLKFEVIKKAATKNDCMGEVLG